MRLQPLILAFALYPALALAEPPGHDGKWEITSTTSMGGNPMGAAQTHTQCITRADPVPKHESAHAKNCKVIDKKIEGSTVSWKMQCESTHGPIDGSGKITYAGDTFNGALTFTMNSPRGAMEITTSMAGKRVGACDAN